MIQSKVPVKAKVQFKPMLSEEESFSVKLKELASNSMYSWYQHFM